jgi:hypothetical protein
MAKYVLNVWGWEMEAIGHSISDEQVERIQEIIDDNEYDELWEVRNNGDLEEDVIDDVYNPDLFHWSGPMDNNTVFFTVEDEKGEKVLEFDGKETNDFWEVMYETMTDDEIEASYPHVSYLAIPEDMEGVDNVLLIIDENKGGIWTMEFESDEVPTPKDFCWQSGSVDTPDGDWDFISRIFFKKQLLEVDDHLDNRGKASTVEIYRKDGSVIN